MGEKLVTVRIEVSQEVWERSKDWLLQESGGKYAYVETDLPKMKRALILEQVLPMESFDLKKVIQAINGL
jgi:hypothetical protein